MSSLPFCPIQGACWIPFFGASAIAVPSSHNSVQPLKPYETWLKNGDLKLKKNARISKGPGVMCFFLLRFCEPPFIYIFTNMWMYYLCIIHLSLSMFLYIYSTCYISIKSSFSHYRYSEIILNLWMDARTRNAFFDQLQQAWKCQARLIRFCPCSRRSFIGWSWASFLVCQCVSQHMGYFVVRSGQWNN